MLNLMTVRARDIMVRDVVELQTLTPIEAAIETLEELGIHGAPVVNEAGELVGVLSATDILKRDQAHDEEEESGRATHYYSLDPFEEDQEFFSSDEYSPEVLGRELVADWMSPQVISVGADASLGEICCLMVREKIHRVFVVEEGEVLGVISTFDVVKRLASEASVGSGKTGI